MYFKAKLYYKSVLLKVHSRNSHKSELSFSTFILYYLQAQFFLYIVKSFEVLCKHTFNTIKCTCYFLELPSLQKIYDNVSKSGI